MKGEPLRFVRGHANRIKRRPPLGPEDYTVEDRGWLTPCWIRVGHRNNKGYGKVTIAGRPMYAHRAMYEQEVGPIPDGMTLDHLCRERGCIRPDHLEPTSMATNLRRGKHVKLNPVDVEMIRNAPSSVSTKKLARAFGVSESHVSKVRRGLKWQPDPPED